jgi:carbon storage regulator
MLVLTRKEHESIVINDVIKVTVVAIRSDKVRLGVQAPPEVDVHRQEVYDLIHQLPDKSQKAPPAATASADPLETIRGRIFLGAAGYGGFTSVVEQLIRTLGYLPVEIDLSDLVADSLHPIRDLLEKCCCAVLVAFPAVDRDGSAVPRPGLQAALEAARELDRPCVLLWEGLCDVPGEYRPARIVRFQDQARDRAILAVLKQLHDARVI